jgi:chromosome segregation ATPase
MIAMDAITLFKTFAPYVGAVATFLIGMFNDRILRALNIKKTKKEVDLTTSEVIEQNLGLYQKLLDDYAKRKEEEDKKQLQRIDSLESEMTKMQAEKDILRKEKEKKEWEVTKLREEIHEIKTMLDKALKQLDFYKKNSNIELPEDLR